MDSPGHQALVASKAASWISIKGPHQLAVIALVITDERSLMSLSVHI